MPKVLKKLWYGSLNLVGSLGSKAIDFVMEASRFGLVFVQRFNLFCVVFGNSWRVILWLEFILIPAHFWEDLYSVFPLVQELKICCNFSAFFCHLKISCCRCVFYTYGVCETFVSLVNIYNQIGDSGFEPNPWM